jgi:hypothetical protein
MTAQLAEYQRTLGKVSGDAKVHLAHGLSVQKILCRFGSAARATAETLAVLPDDADTCEILLQHGIKLSALCKNCFSVKLRALYQQVIQAAIAAEAAIPGT